MKFEPLPTSPEPAASSMTKFQVMLLEWDTTPSDLREDGEKSLAGFSKAKGFTPGRAMKAMQSDSYKLARRQLSIEKGELDYKTRTVIDAAYVQAAKGSKDARRDWLDFYQPERRKSAVQAETPATPDPADPAELASPDEMSDEQLEATMAEWADSE
jgi:hypothetical protein